MVMENKKKLGDQNMDINKLSSHLKSELLNLSKKTLNESDSKYSLDPKWSEKLLKMESEMEIINKRTQIYEKKMDDFFFFKHTEELKEINNKFEELRFELIKINEKIFAKTLDSPENKRDSSSIISPLNSPQNNDMAIIDDKRYNSLIEKTKNNIDLAMSHFFIFIYFKRKEFRKFTIKI